MAVVDGDVLPAIYFLTLFLLEQYRFLDLQEAYIFDNDDHVMKLCPKVPFRPQRHPTVSQAESTPSGYLKKSTGYLASTNSTDGALSIGYVIWASQSAPCAEIQFSPGTGSWVSSVSLI
ncbi:hypothetical protein PV04_07800 [Phialophora macrospora]|uniref:Uncharacterized protein n=1 Tax=Phialophora macrospora TaxID=1851006 RepID=A0A0D2CJY2_9EURO|nr:hypothetical protein PV04_07800 [Phialophora macrospora]